MKLRNLLLGMLLCATAASAQDVITKTDGSKIDAKVEEVTDAVIRYRKASNPSGPVYTVPITSVTTIVYENGSVDTFNAPATTSTTTVSDDELLRYAEAQNITGTSNSTYLNDAHLMRLVSNNSLTPDELRKKAKKYRIIGWAGGAAFVIIGVAASTAAQYDYVKSYIMIAGAGAGVGWCLGFNLKARSLMNQARELEYLSATIIEDKILSFGNKSLMAGVNVMGNRMPHTQGVGLSLKLNF
ncbi:MAG: hypothetical protein K2N28_07660 [Muribaculaceae bacterium]|nr:hypothetical protein [Muribaculaceae bacterium]